MGNTLIYSIGELHHTKEYLTHMAAPMMETNKSCMGTDQIPSVDDHND